MTIRAAGAFDGRWTVCWATSYTFEPVFFESFLLSRLGGPPLNATLLLDARRYADALQDLATDAPWRSTRANRDYLVRGVSPTLGAFHPKTYLFANDRGGRLLVGSGNLAMSGLETGKETFAAFESDADDGLAAIRSWRTWMDALVVTVGDAAVRERWTNALIRAPWLAGAAGRSAFVANWDRPILDALLEGLEAPVDEVHMTAPFFDRRAEAVAELLRRTQPRRVTLMLGRDASADGATLAAVLDASGAQVDVLGVEPDTFVHAKLVGVVHGDQGRLLSGSANLSAPALLRAASSDPHANVEAGAIAETDAAGVRAAFAPPGLKVVARGGDALGGLRFSRSPDAVWPVALRSCTRLPDRRVSVVVASALDPALRLVDDSEAGELDAAGVTVAPFAGDATRLAWLADAAGAQVSNKVAIDEPDALRAALQDRAEAAGDRPAGIEAADLETPVGQMLARLHEACIFDFDDTPTARRIPRAVEDDEDPEFWDRLAREDLRSDPRLPRYQQLAGQLELLDGLFLDIARMRDAVPPLPHLAVAAGAEAEAGTGGTGTRWTPDRRLQVRLFNLLERWCAALSDPRLLWISPTAPAANYAALVAALHECWLAGYLPEARVTKLVGVLLGAMVATERRRGFLAGLDDEDAQQVAAALASSAAPEIAAGLVYASVRPARRDLLDYLFDWQRALRLAGSLGAVRISDRSAAAVLELTGTGTTPTAMEERLAWAATYTNDTRWCEVVGRELRLGEVTFVPARVAARFGAVVRVPPGVDLLRQPRVVELVRRALEYRATAAVIVESGPDRLIVELGATPLWRRDDRIAEGGDILTKDDLEALAASGGAFGSLLEQPADLAG